MLKNMQSILNIKDKMKMLFLDDDLNRHRVFKDNFGNKFNDITYVETAQEAIDALIYMDYDSIFLDHDLGGEYFTPSHQKSGHEVAKYIANNLESKPIIIIHSLNPAGAIRMYNTLRDGGFNPVLSPFTCLMGQY